MLDELLRRVQGYQPQQLTLASDFPEAAVLVPSRAVMSPNWC